MTSLFNLHWRRPSSRPSPHPIPSNISRTHITTSSGPLELLSAIPTTANNKPPLIFLHGGFGAAYVWLPWLTIFQSASYPCYAISLRGHGDSWLPGFWSMVWGTRMENLADDAVRGAREVRRLEIERRGGGNDDGLEPVIIGHSSGGGLAQYLLSEGLVRVRGLVLCAAVPGGGSLGVYLNWFKLDPFFPIRNWLHFFHPRSPLSSTRLVRNVFFTEQFSEHEVKDFEHWMPWWESMRWPVYMMRPFVSWSRLVQNVSGWGRGSRVCVVAGSQDRIVSAAIAKANAESIREAFKQQVESKKLELENGTERINGEDGVDFVVVEKGPHHFQNDLCRDSAAKQVLKFLNNLD